MDDLPISIGQPVGDSGDPGRPRPAQETAIFIVYHDHPGRSREVLHYFKVFHYHFSLCFCLIACKAEKQSEKNANFGNVAFCTLALPLLAV